MEEKGKFCPTHAGQNCLTAGVAQRAHLGSGWRISSFPNDFFIVQGSEAWWALPTSRVWHRYQCWCFKASQTERGRQTSEKYMKSYWVWSCPFASSSVCSSKTMSASWCTVGVSLRDVGSSYSLWHFSIDLGKWNCGTNSALIPWADQAPEIWFNYPDKIKCERWIISTGKMTRPFWKVSHGFHSIPIHLHDYVAIWEMSRPQKKVRLNQTCSQHINSSIIQAQKWICLPDLSQFFYSSVDPVQHESTSNKLQDLVMPGTTLPQQFFNIQKVAVQKVLNPTVLKLLIVVLR